MSYDRLLADSFASLREGLYRHLKEVCQLSKSATALGFRTPVPTSSETKPAATGIVTYYPPLDQILVYMRHLGTEPQPLETTSPVDLLRLKKFNWAPENPYHPLEALGAAAD